MSERSKRLRCIGDSAKPYFTSPLPEGETLKFKPFDEPSREFKLATRATANRALKKKLKKSFKPRNLTEDEKREIGLRKCSILGKAFNASRP